MRIYLNRQITTLGATSDLPDTLVATGITVEAIDVHLTDANVGGQRLSGDIMIGISSAK